MPVASTRRRSTPTSSRRPARVNVARPARSVRRRPSRSSHHSGLPTSGAFTGSSRTRGASAPGAARASPSRSPGPSPHGHVRAGRVVLGARDLHAPVGQDRGRVGDVGGEDRVVVVDEAPGRDELVGEGRGRAHDRRGHRDVDHGEPVRLEDLGRLAERQAVEREGGPRRAPASSSRRGTAPGGTRARSSRRRTRIASVLAIPVADSGANTCALTTTRSPWRCATATAPSAPSGLRSMPTPIGSAALSGRSPVGRPPRAVAEPGVLEPDELVEVVAAPLEERAAGPKARELGAQVLAVVEPGDGVRGVPDRGVLDVRVAGSAVPVDEGAVDPVAVDEQRAPVLELAGSGEHRLEQLGEDALAGHAGRRDPEREGLLAGAGAGRERGVELGGLVGVELVDDVGRGVEAVLERGVGRQGAHDPAVAGALDRVPVGDEPVEQERAALDHAPGLPQDDAGLVAGGRGDVDLGLGLAVGVEHVQAGGAGHRGLRVLARDAEADLVVDAETGRGVELEGLPPELALPVLVDERPAGPAALGVADVPLAVRGEVGAAGRGHRGPPLSPHRRPPEAAAAGRCRR